MRRFKITVGDRVFDVSVEEGGPVPTSAGPPVPTGPVPVGAPAVSAPAVPTPPAAGLPAPSGGSAVRSPLAGKVVAVDVVPGSEVGEADRLLTIEAMKMNTHVYAPRAGRVGQILVAPGDAVEEGQELLRLA